MKEQVFNLTTAELNDIAESLRKKIEEGLGADKDKQEIAAIPTYIYRPEAIPDGKVLALDWGGENFRAAVVEFKAGKASIVGNVEKQRLSKAETKGFNREKLHETMARYISRLQALDNTVTRIGYCFSYAAKSEPNGDAALLYWTKGIDIPDMIGEPVGEPLLNYLNNYKDINTRFNNIKVINDTVACLFAGLDETGYDSYIGLIVGTGTNMAGLMPSNKVAKLNSQSAKLIPINLESGNFRPPHLTVIDGMVDAMSNNRDEQRFEKAISGGYLGELFKMSFPYEKIKYNFSGGDLAAVINHPSAHPEEQVKVARAIYDRSAKLVAASIAGFVRVLTEHDASIKKIALAADGSVFWGKNNNGEYAYKNLVQQELSSLLPQGVTVTIMNEKKDPNLVGSAIAVLA